MVALLFPSVDDWPQMLGIMAGMEQKNSIPRDRCCARCRQLQWYVHGWFYWCCSSRCVPSFGRQAQDTLAYMKLSVAGAAVPQLQFIEGRRHPCLYADADPHGPVCSENHRDSPVARRHGGRCPFRAGRSGSHVQVVGGTVVLPQFLHVEKIVVSFEVVDILVVTQRLFPMVQAFQQTIEIPQLFVDMAVEVPVVWMQQVPQCRKLFGSSADALRGGSDHGRDDLSGGFLGPCTLVQGWEACPQGHGLYNHLQDRDAASPEIRHYHRV